MSCHYTFAGVTWLWLSCRIASEYAKSTLEAATQELIDLIFSDAMFQEAMQVTLLLLLPHDCHVPQKCMSLFFPFCS